MEKIKERILKFMEWQEFPKEAIDSLTVAVQAIFESEGKEILKKIVQEYQSDYRISPTLTTERTKEISEHSGIDQRQCNLIVYMGLAEELKKHYLSKGYPVENYNDTIRELKCKLLECHDCFGVWGARTCAVINTHFAMTRFGMGVFQFELIRLERGFVVEGKEFKQGDLAINIHIPRLGEPISYEERHKAYKKAKEFFKSRFPNEEKVPFYCHTWILFKKHREILKPTSNMISFMDDFSVLRDYEYPDYNEAWRVYGRIFTKIEDMPQETSLQKAYAEIIRRGEKIGGAEGMFLL